MSDEISDWDYTIHLRLIDQTREEADELRLDIRRHLGDNYDGPKQIRIYGDSIQKAYDA